MVSEGKAASLCEAYLNGLNPCFSGGWSRRPIRRASMRIRKRRVLILVLVEDGLGADASPRSVRKRGSLNPCFSGGWSRRLILLTPRTQTSICLNPCFSGGWSRRDARGGHPHRCQSVLILVLVEDGLGAQLTRSRRPPRQRS